MDAGRTHFFRSMYIFQEIENAQEAFVTLLGQIKSDHKLKFLNWVCQEYNPVVTSEPGDGRGYELLEEPEAPGTYQYRPPE